MDILARINEDLVTSMKSRTEELRVSTLRMMKSAIKNAEIAKRGKGALLEEDILSVLSTMVKQRKESVEQYQKGNRPDLVEKETREIAIIQQYLPEQLTVLEIDSLIHAAIKKAGVTGVKEMGKLMKELMPMVKGKADGKTVNQRVKEILEKMPS
jgi:uncharacterized protein YqeY